MRLPGCRSAETPARPAATRDPPPCDPGSRRVLRGSAPFRSPRPRSRTRVRSRPSVQPAAGICAGICAGVDLQSGVHIAGRTGRADRLRVARPPPLCIALAIASVLPILVRAGGARRAGCPGIHEVARTVTAPPTGRGAVAAVASVRAGQAEVRAVSAGSGLGRRTGGGAAAVHAAVGPAVYPRLRGVRLAGRAQQRCGAN